MTFLYRFDSSASPPPGIPTFEVLAGQVCRIGAVTPDANGIALVRSLLRHRPGKRVTSLDAPVACGSTLSTWASGYGNVPLRRLFHSGYRLPPTSAEKLEDYLDRRISSFQPNAPLAAYPSPAQILITVEAALATANPVVLYHLDPHVDDRQFAYLLRKLVTEAIGSERCAIEVVWDYDRGPVDISVGDPRNPG